MYAVGMNNYGQCGFPNTLNMQIEHFAKIYMPGQLKVTQIAIGDHHALCLAGIYPIYYFIYIYIYLYNGLVLTTYVE